MTDWNDLEKSSRPLKFRVLLRFKLLEAIARVNLRFARQAKLLTYGGLECGPNLQRVFRTVLDKSMMQRYKRAMKKEEETAKINKEVLGNWKLLVKKDGDTRRYRDAFLKDDCAFAVKDTITDFGMEHGICLQALVDYVIGALRESFDLRAEDGGWPYYPLEDNED